MKKCLLIKKEEIDGALAQVPVAGKRQLEPFKTLFGNKDLAFSIIEDYKVGETEAEVHKREGDLWHCLEGEAEFVYGGELTESWVKEGYVGNELGGKGIAGGIKVVLRPGDWLWIPPGQPHMHKSEEAARMAIIKVVAD